MGSAARCAQARAEDGAGSETTGSTATRSTATRSTATRSTATRSTATRMTQATTTALPCAACKQPVIEKRTLDGAVVVLDAATKRMHLCVKRKEVEAAKAKQMAASRAKA